MDKKRQARLDKALTDILDKLINQYRADKIILFGSMANDAVGEWSDIDLVIVKETPRPFLQRSVEVALLCLARVGVDYLVYTPDEFAQMIVDKNHFILNEVLDNGKVLYERQSATTMSG